MSAKLDRIASAAAIALCCLGAATLVVRKERADQQDLSRFTYEPGERLTGFEAVHFSATQYTVILFVSTTCEYCASSMPFYRNLVRMASQDATKLNVAILGFEPDGAIRNYLRQHDLDLAHVHSIQGSRTRLQLTPTLILADRDGVVAMAIVGQLLPEQERAVLSHIDSL